MANLSNINGKFVVEQTTGYVGVGTTDPNYPIEVLNASAEIALNASGGSIYRVQSDSASNFIIRKEGVGDRLVINSAGNSTFAGNVTVGNSGNINIPTAASGNANLHFDGTDFKITSNSSSANLKLETSSTTRLTINSVGNATFAGDVTVGADAAGHDVMFRGETSGAYFSYDASEDGVVIVAPTDEVALGIRVVGGAQPTIPQFTVGRGTNQYLGIKVDDRISQVIHRQDETDAGIMQMNQEIWDNGTGVHKWNWRSADGAGASASTKMTLNKTGELYLPGSVGIGEATPDGRLHIHQTGSGTSNTIITEDDARKIFIGRDSIKATDLSNNAQILHLQQNGGRAVFGGNVGIGQTGPGQKLVIGNYDSVANGTMRITALGGQAVGTIRNSLEFSLSSEFSVNSGDAYKFSIGLNSAVGTSGNYNSDFVIRRTTRLGVTDNVDFMIDGTSGNVGIGTTTPETPLHVLTNTTDNASTMLIQNGSTGDASIKFNISGDTYSIGIDNSDSDKFKLSYGAVGTNDRIVVDTSGNVSIGTTNNGSKLNVGGTIAAATNDNSNGMIVPRSLGLSHPGNTGTFTRTFNPVTLFGMGFRGGQVLFECTGWQMAMNNGYIMWRNAGGGDPIGTSGSVQYVQTAYVSGAQSGSNTIAVSLNTGTNNITITFTGWHGNAHGFMCRITTNYM